MIRAKFRFEKDIEAVPVTIGLTLTVAQWRLIRAALKNTEAGWAKPVEDLMKVIRQVLDKAEAELLSEVEEGEEK